MPARLYSLGWLTLVALSLLDTGCEHPTDQARTTSPGASTSEPGPINASASAITPDPAPAPTPATAPAQLKLATWDEIEKAVTGTGGVTIVDLWSLSCAPCLKEFPGLVRLHQQFGDSVQCIGVNVDYDGRKTRPAQTYEARVSDFLASVDSTFMNYVCTTPSDDVYRLADIDSIPTVLIYDAHGKLVKKFVDAGETAGFTYDKDVLPLVTEMMK